VLHVPVDEAIDSVGVYMKVEGMTAYIEKVEAWELIERP
jgi:hypothetical protein